MNNIKFAIQLAGQARDWSKAQHHFYLLKDSFKSHNIDVDFFLSTWDREGIKQYDKQKSNQGDKIVIDRYLISKAHTTNQDSFDFTKSTSVGMVYHWTESTWLRLQYEREHNIQYDFVMIARPDIVFIKPFFDEIVKLLKGTTKATLGVTNVVNMDGNVLYQNNNTADITKANTYNLGTNDEWVIGQPTTMNIFLSLYDYYKAELIPNMNHMFLSSFCKQTNIQLDSIKTIDYQKLFNRKREYPKTL